MDALDVIEDMFYVRKQKFEVGGNDGIKNAFSETNASDSTNKIKPKKVPKRN